jgi:hypothetical protein
MPSSITLTVSHLPTSTSFFLSALQPLNYAYRGRSNNTIGFGSSVEASAPPDFWITQEVPGVPAGAAHVAFEAPSEMAVQQYFAAALKAGGQIHGEPAVRDSSGYYSAAVIDFDGNSIEAVFRPSLSDDKEYDMKSTVSSRSMTKAVSEVKSHTSRAPPSAIGSCVSRSAPPSEAPTPARSSSGDMLNGVVSIANVARSLAQSMNGSQAPQPRPSGDGDSNAIFGTLLGVAAGAALHYAFTHDQAPNSRPAPSVRSATEPVFPSQYQSYSQVEAPQYIALEDNDSASAVRPSRSTTSSHRNNNGRDQTVYSTGFGNGSIAPTTASRASQRTSAPKMIEAPPPAPPSSLHFRRPSQLAHSASYETVPPSQVSKAPSSTRHHHHSSRIDANPPPPTTTTTKTRHLLRTISDSQMQRTDTYPPPSAAAISRAATVPYRPAALSEANLARISSAPAAAPVTAATVSVHTKHRDPDAYPVDDGGSRSWSRSKSNKKGASKVGSRSERGGGGSKVGEGSTSGSKKMAVEVTPEDSVSQISGVSASTVRVRRRK